MKLETRGYIPTHLVCGIVGKGVKQKGIDTVGIDDGKGYREQW